MAEIKIVYIDDKPDEILTAYLDEVYCNAKLDSPSGAEHVTKIYKEVKFIGNLGYECLLQDTDVRSANVILIDNHLFEEQTAGSGKFSGKQFKVILRKLFPFVEVIIITQDQHLNGDNIIHKFAGRNGEDTDEYYKNNLDSILDGAIREVIEFEALAEDLKKSKDVEKALVDKILQSLQGNDSYDEMTKEDIDQLILSFKELKESCAY
ncbi:hypothetical protein M2145_001054 [Lachnospiraceae bacterium PF1-21]|uniref:Uncharacterized protein n=1 Tax=Ohessyouella blattaphilus TaxID=2949333 RepID=A0ABT1EJJ0_9FIRM|nr:hypothetical protein [Ohessyouella blattaphilus]MCP1110876.1 hypothetical protein [Ohessyouella blattaphilus]MCR8564270.1 hypothetical protein [Ohessyouella blattaphilus]